MGGFQRVALVNIRIESRQRIPIGLLSIAAYCRDISHIVIFDPDPDQTAFDDIIAFQPDLIGIGFMTQTRFRAKQIYEALRAQLTNAKIVLGGVGPTVEKEFTFELFQPEAIVVGEGEKPFKRIVAGDPLDQIPGVYRPGIPFRPSDVFADLDDIPLPAYECMPDFENYLCPPGGIRGKWFKHGTPMIMTGRGCPFRCSFCCSRLMFTRHVRRRSPANVLLEVRRLHDVYGIDAVYFFDDTFTAPPSWTKAFCEALLAEPYKVQWGCQIRADVFDVELGRLMRKAGCVQVDIGVESGSTKVLKAIGKDETIENMVRTFKACHDVGIGPMATFLVGCPEETWEDVDMTKALVRQIRPSFAEFFYLIPYPGTELYDQAIKNNWLVDRSYEGRGMVDRPVMEINFSLEQQRQIRRDYFKMMAFQNLKGYLSLNVLTAFLLSMRWSMIRAFALEFIRTRNIRDAMQAYVHALRRYYSKKYKWRSERHTCSRGG